MTRPWSGFQNTQNYLECQLVSAINAFYYLTGEKIEIGSDGYEELVDLSGGRDRSCLCMSAVYERLGIKIEKTFDSSEEFMNNLVFPMEKIVHGGLHSVLITDWDASNKKVRLTNFGVSRSGWVTEEVFYSAVRVRDKNFGKYKLFSLVR